MRFRLLAVFALLVLCAASIVAYSEPSSSLQQSTFLSFSSSPSTGFVSALSFANSKTSALPAIPKSVVCDSKNSNPDAMPRSAWMYRKTAQPAVYWYIQVFKKEPASLYLYWKGRLVKKGMRVGYNNDDVAPFDFPVLVSVGIPGKKTAVDDKKTPEGDFCLEGPYTRDVDGVVRYYYPIGSWGDEWSDKVDYVPSIYLSKVPAGFDEHQVLGKAESDGSIWVSKTVLSWFSKNDAPTPVLWLFKEIPMTIYGENVGHPNSVGYSPSRGGTSIRDEAAGETVRATQTEYAADAAAEFSACPVSITKPLPNCKNPDGKDETNCISWSFKTSVKNVHKEYDTGAGGYLKQVFFGKRHGALDIELPVRTPLKAIEGGVVEYLSGEKSDCGLGVLVTTNGKNINDKNWRGYWYCHMSKIKVKKGQPVKKDAPLGLSGKTGIAPTPHVHVAKAAYNKEKSRYEVLKDVDGLCKKAGGVASEQQETVSIDGQEDSGVQQAVLSAEAPSEQVVEQTAAETGEAGKKKTGITDVTGGTESEDCPDEPSGEFTQGDYACVYFNIDEVDGAKDKFFDVAFAAYGSKANGGSNTIARYAVSRKGITYPEGYAGQVAFREGVLKEKDGSYKGAYWMKLTLKRLSDEAPTGFFLRMFLSESADVFSSFNPERRVSGAETEYEGIKRKAIGYVVRAGVPDESKPKADAPATAPAPEEKTEPSPAKTEKLSGGLAGKLIAVSAGHSDVYEPEPGTVYKEAVSGVFREVDLNKEVRNRLVKLLDAAGAKTTIGPPKADPTNYDFSYERFMYWARDQGADMVIMIHHDSADSKVPSPYVYYETGGKQVASDIINSLNKNGFGSNPNNIESNDGRQLHIRHYKAKDGSLLVEIDKINHVAAIKAQKGSLDEYYDKAAKAIFDGIKAYYGVASTSATPAKQSSKGCPPFNEKEKLSPLKTTRGVALNGIIEKYAKEYDVSVTLVAAMMNIESTFDERASSGQALGLMQVKPDTARGSCGISNPNDLFDPEKNVKCGIRYLKAQCDKFKNTDLVAAAYNAGPGAVEKYGGIPPYPETQRHVTKFRAALATYVAQVSKNMGVS